MSEIKMWINGVSMNTWTDYSEPAPVVASNPRPSPNQMKGNRRRVRRMRRIKSDATRTASSRTASINRARERWGAAVLVTGGGGLGPDRAA